jgi:hypothetical protein
MAPTPFGKLKAKWDKKLLDSGFNDIENADGSLKKEVDYRTTDYAMTDGREEYYRQAQQYSFTGEFSTMEEQLIWNKHCEGQSFRTIASLLNITFYKVRTIVIKHQKLAGVRHG